MGKVLKEDTNFVGLRQKNVESWVLETMFFTHGSYQRHCNRSQGP